MAEYEARIGRGETVARFKAYASVWHDLLHVRQVLYTRSEYPAEARHVFLRRALWEGAVIAYGRCFNQGSRQQLIKAFFDGLPPDDRALHDHFDDFWRDKHVAHRVRGVGETVEAALVITETAGLAKFTDVRARVATVIGPEVEAEVDQLSDLADRLKDRIWIEHLQPLADELVEEARPRIAKLRQFAKEPPKPKRSKNELILTIDPHGPIPLASYLNR